MRVVVSEETRASVVNEVSKNSRGHEAFLMRRGLSLLRTSPNTARRERTNRRPGPTGCRGCDPLASHHNVITR
jgi:hypothetical protein